MYSNFMFIDRLFFELSCKNTHTHTHTETHTRKHTHADSYEYSIVAATINMLDNIDLIKVIKLRTQ